MLNFRNTTILLVLLLGVAACYDIGHGLPVIIYFLLAFFYSLLLFYGSYFVWSDFFIQVICSVRTDKKEIAISFDDGPAANYTSDILQVLKAHDIETTFFCIGGRIPGNEQLLRQIHEQGHSIGNHSYSHHFWFDLFSSRKMLADLQMMDKTMEAATGLKPRMFRPPYGVTNPNLKKAIRQGNYIPVGWSVRSMDTVIHDEKKLLERVMRSIKPGAIVLFHDTSKTTLDMLPVFIRLVKEKGYDIRRLDKMLTLNAYA